MAVSYHRPTKIIVDLQAIQQNLANEIKHNQGKDVFVAVKANGYGHGAVPVAKAALAAGAMGLCVATLDEAIELREQGIEAPILLLGLLPLSAVAVAEEYRVAVAVASLAWLKQAQPEIRHALKIHLAIDTGMGRIGFQKSEDVQQAVNYLLSEEVFDFEGIFTHFSTADQADTTYWEKQHQRFNDILTGLSHLPKYVHTSNSATTLWHEGVGNMVRYGIALYGLNPSGNDLDVSYPLQPALSLESELIQVKKVAKGEGIGYGKTYVTPKEEWIGTVPIGYADGYVRKMQGFHVLVEGQYCEIVGRVCMDQLMIRLPHAIEEGTKVTLIGKNQGAQITLQEIADYLDTIHYEVICLFSERIPREYL
ncbi:alanine racemase [Candidatus Enterococcus willemsii]|uniref:Alanine racemase n=1 Tax=Candidatus Enterococcus willemsii TaxID=1857215 RepID=A0ABQ6Z236_9ENTE|nr:alanine racemase [Enterococcus sp. CU12B]KAF1305676.1 alanine racemase [Enterococcus sp. CU12B]